MTVNHSTGQAAEVPTAVSQVEDWLLTSGVQIPQGEHRGGIGGWLDESGRPEFIYPEIVGYYLTAMAWLSSGAASSSDRAESARRRARQAAGWLASSVADKPAPATRIYLVEGHEDWRNGAVFSFDIAMAARGFAASGQLSAHEHQQILNRLCDILRRISSGVDFMASHELVAGDMTTLPERWSTRRGPHHLKAAAAVLRLPDRNVGKELLGVAQRTCDHWAASFESDSWPCSELHAILYACEGMLLAADRLSDRDAYVVVERVLNRLVELQASDGTLPETVDGGIIRSDVQAQALRVGLLLRARQYLGGSSWTDRMDGLTDALLSFVQPDGGVLFSRQHPVSNTWCATFAIQALYLRSLVGTPDAPTLTRGLLV